MSEHLTPQGIDGHRKRCLRILCAVAGEPSGKFIVAKLPYHVVVAACGETREVAFRPVFDGRLVCRMAFSLSTAAGIPMRD
jgi:hypothetical protein